MASSADLGLPSPELTDLADAPAALKALADMVDAKMTRLRNWMRVNGQGMSGSDLGTLVTAGTTVQIMPAQSPALLVVGSCEVDFDVVLMSDNTAATTWAGSLLMYLNGTQVSTNRWHNHGATRLITASCQAAISLPVGVSSLTFGVNMFVDTLSNSSVRAIEWELNVRQYGALRV